MDGNPWEVDSIHAFSCFKCPECAFFGQEEYSFQNHALGTIQILRNQDFDPFGADPASL